MPRKKMSPAELDALARITPSDIERAKAAWEQDAPPAFRRLLDAKDDGTSEKSGTTPPDDGTIPSGGSA